MLDTVLDGGRPSGQDFLVVALNAPNQAMDTLDELCDLMQFEPNSPEDIANMFAFKTPEQLEEFLRRLL